MDIYIIINLNIKINYIFMADCDGHGVVGQEILNYLKENLQIDHNHTLREEKAAI